MRGRRVKGEGGGGRETGSRSGGEVRGCGFGGVCGVVFEGGRSRRVSCRRGRKPPGKEGRDTAPVHDSSAGRGFRMFPKVESSRKKKHVRTGESATGGESC